MCLPCTHTVNADTVNAALEGNNHTHADSSLHAALSFNTTTLHQAVTRSAPLLSSGDGNVGSA